CNFWATIAHGFARPPRPRQAKFCAKRNPALCSGRLLQGFPPPNATVQARMPMNHPLPLFRQQVLDRHDTQRLRGALILSQPLAHWLFTAFLTGLVAIALAFLVRHDYARKQSVTGTLVPDRGLLELRAPAAGSIASLHVAADAEVEAGTPLFIVRF